MLALAPVLPRISSVYRGYFEGLRNMLPARSQVAESLGKLIFGLSGAIFDAYGHTGAASERHGIRLYREKVKQMAVSLSAL